MSDNALANRQETSSIERIKNYMMSAEVKDRFAEMMGADGIYYLNQVMILVANSDDLQKCEPKSILIAAMRAASLKLSVDPSSGQAWIIPYKNKATFQLGYKGVYELALRTNQYRFINVIDIFEGEVLIEDRMTGIHKIGGKRTGDKVVARMLYFQLFNGFEKTFPMTIEEIDAHARHYSQAYNSPKSKWNDPIERPKMERKTVLVNGLRRYGRFNAADREIIEQIEGDTNGFIGLPDESQVTPPPPPVQRANGEILADLGYDNLPSEAQPEPEGDAEPAASTEKPWTATAVSLETAQAATSSDGTLYWDMQNDALTFRLNSIKKVLGRNGLSQEEREDKQFRHDVILAILQYRSQS